MRPEDLERCEDERAKQVLEAFKKKFFHEAVTKYSKGTSFEMEFEVADYAIDGIFDWLRDNGWHGRYWVHWRKWDICTMKQYRKDHPPPAKKLEEKNAKQDNLLKKILRL